MNKNIKIEIAVGIILIIAIITGGLLWLNNKKIERVSTPVINQLAVKPSCEELNITQEQIDATVAESISNVQNPWGNKSDFQLLLDRIETKLGCTLEKSSITYAEQLKPTTLSNLDDWKNYRNDEYGFSFNYPADDKLTPPARLSDFPSGNFGDDHRQYCLESGACLGLIESTNIKYSTQYSHGAPLPATGVSIRVDVANIKNKELAGLTPEMWQKKIKELLEQPPNASSDSINMFTETNKNSVQLLVASYKNGSDIAFYNPQNQSVIGISLRMSESEKTQGLSIIKTIISTIQLD